MSDRPFNPTYSLRGITAQAQAGLLGAIPNVTLGLAGMLGSRWAADANERVQSGINNALDVQDPNWRADPTGFLARTVGGAVPVGIARGGQLALSGGARLLEALTPVTISTSARTLPINIGVQAGLGAGVQELVDVEQNARNAAATAQQQLPERIDVITGSDASQPPLVEGTGAGLPERIDVDPLPERIDVPQTSGSGITMSQPRLPQPGEDRDASWAGPILRYVVPGFAAAGLVGAGVAAARSVAAGRRADQAMAGTVVQPGIAYNPEVERLGRIDTVQQAVVSNMTAAERALQQAVEGTGLPPGATRLNQSVADDALGRMQTQLAESPKNDIVSNIARTGYNPLTGNSFRPLADIEMEVAALKRTNPDSVARAMDALAAGTEHDVRIVNGRAGRFVPGQPGEPARVTLHDKSFTDLVRMMRDGQNDPVAARIMLEYRRSTDAMLEEMRAMGLKSADDITNMVRDNPNYMHWIFSEEQAIRDPSGARILTTGSENNNPINARVHGHEAGALRSQDPISALNEAWRKVLALGLENDARVAFVNSVMPHVMQMQRASPDTPRLVRGLKVRDQDKTPGGWVPVHFYQNGKRMAVEVAPPVAEVLQSYPRATVPFVSAMTRMFRNMTTGPLAAAFGSVMAPVSASMATMATAVNRPKGTAFGLADAAVQKLSGGRGGLRADPTSLGLTAYAALADLGSEGSRAIASALRNSELNNGVMARWLGPAQLASIKNAAQAAYDSSILAEMRRQGSAGTGLARDPESARTLAVQHQTHTPDYAALAQRRTDSGGIDAIKAAAEQYGARLTPPTAARLWQLYTTSLDIVSSAATSAYIRQNANVQGMSPKALHGMARRVAGDPAEMGASPFAQAAYSMVPYSNIAVQSLTAYLRAVKRNPAAATAGIAAAVALPQMAQLASAIIADEDRISRGEQPQYVMWMMNQNANGQANDIRIFIPGVSPENGMRVPTDLSLAPLSAYTNNLLLGMIGADTDRFWSPEMAAVRRNFVDFMTDRTRNGVVAGVQSMSPVNTPPPLLTAVARTGYDLDISSASRFGEPRVTVPRDVGAPGYTRSDNWNDPASRMVSDIAQTLFSSTGTAALEIARTVMYSSRLPNGDPLGAAGEQYRLNSASTMRLAPPLLQPDRQLAQRDAVGDIVAKKEAALTNLRNGIADATRPGTVGSGNVINMPIGEGRPGVHPEMREAVLIGNRWFSAIDRLANIRRERQQQLTSIDSSPLARNDPAASRRARNEVTQDIRRINRQIYSQMEEAETFLSRRTGRAVRFETLDPQRGLDQFPPYNPQR